MEFLADLVYWDWLILGVVLIIIELFATSVFFLWMGVAALIVGGILYQLPHTTWEVQLFIFSMLSISLIYLAKRFWRVRSGDNQLNKRTHRMIGNTYRVAEVSNNGVKVRVNDSLWLTRGCEEAKIDQHVKVVAVDSTVLIVEASTKPLPSSD